MDAEVVDAVGGADVVVGAGLPVDVGGAVGADAGAGERGRWWRGG